MKTKPLLVTFLVFIFLSISSFGVMSLTSAPQDCNTVAPEGSCTLPVSGPDQVALLAQITPAYTVTSSAFSGNILHETFDGSTSCGTSQVSTCDLTWTKVTNWPNDFDNTTAPPIGQTGFTTQACKFSVAGDTQGISHTFASANIVYTSFNVYITTLAMSAAPSVSTIARITSANSWALDVNRTATNTYYFTLIGAGQSANSTSTIATGTAYRIDIYANATTNVVTWKINGTAQTAVPGELEINAMTGIAFGWDLAGDYHGSTNTLHFDTIDLDSGTFAP
jgi:hypothetical protein